MKIGFLYPSWTGAYGIFGYFARRNSGWPPMNLALLAAIVEEAGHEAFIVDGQVEDLTPKQLAEKTLALKPDIIGFTATSPFFHIQKDTAEALKSIAPEIPIIVGGPHVSIVKEEALLPCFDYAFVGEVEKSLPQFLGMLENGQDISSAKGIIFRRDGESHFTGHSPWLEDMNSLPFPARHLLDMDSYKIGTLNGRNHFTTIQGQRGCPWKCIFCASEHLNTTRIIRRTPENIVAEMKQVVDRYDVRHFQFYDDVLTLSREHILAVCDEIEKHGLRITFEGSTRANLVDDAMIKRMSECGLIRMSFGVETVNPEMRKTIKKKVPMKHYIEANRILNKYNVEATNTLMIGLPGETRETVNETLEFLKNSREVKQANLAITVPYPGTELYEMAISGENGIKLLSRDFSEYRRYGMAVTEINGLTPKDLVNIQNEGFIAIYSAPWRWQSMWAKHGFIGVLLLFIRISRLVGQVLRRKIPFFKDDHETATDAAPSLPSGHHGTPNNPNS